MILDEPTAVLTPQEIDELMAVIRRLKAEGTTVILITHKLREIKAVADRCTVLRRGRTIGTVDVADTGESTLAEMMVGRAVKFRVDKEPAKPGRVVLTIRDLTVHGSHGHHAVRNLSLDVRAGEILGLAGVDGNGQTELLRAIAGLQRPVSGSVILDGQDITLSSVRQRTALGLSHIPEDRQRHGLVSGFRLDENLALKRFHLSPFSRRSGRLDFKVMTDHALRLIRQYDIRAGKGPATLAGDMSGGNQQKAIIARELDLGPSCLVVAQPTRGLDVGAIEYIHSRLVAERDAGRAILLVSCELDEVLSLCDRVAAMSAGSIAGILVAAVADEHLVGAMMAGVRPENFPGRQA